MIELMSQAQAVRSASVANVLRSFGTKKDESVLDDTVSIYLRITWQAVTTFLACAY